MGALPQFTMDSELDKLAKWTRELTRDMDGEVTNKTLRGVAFKFLRRVMRRTTVDTGRARAGWTAMLDAHGIPYTAAGGDPAEIAKGKAEGSYSETDTSIEIINGVPYIVALEYGHSKKNPAGMVRITVNELTGAVSTPEERDALEQKIIKADRKARLRGG